MVRLLGGLAITVMTLYCSPRARTGKRRGTEGSGLYPELAAYRISEGNSPNVQAEVGPGPGYSKCCSSNDFQKEVVGPATASTFHGDAVALGMLLQER